MQANCVYVVFNIKSDIAAAQQPYIGNDFMLNQFAVCKRSMLHFNPLIFFPGKNPPNLLSLSTIPYLQL